MKVAASKPWTQEQIAKASELRGRGYNWADIAFTVGRTARSVEDKIRSLGVKAPKPGEQGDFDPTDSEVLRLERELQRTNKELKNSNSKLAAERQYGGLFEQLSTVIVENTSPLDGISETAPLMLLPGDRQHSVDAVAILSDEHSDAEITAEQTSGLETYNFDIFRTRMERWGKVVARYLTEHLPNYTFNRLWVFSLGDGVNGDIHGAGPNNSWGNTLKAATALGDVRAQVLEGLSRIVPINYVGISGNHPRRSVRKDYSNGPHDNFDYLANVQMATRLSSLIDSHRVSVVLPNSWSAFVEVRNRVWALNHGDDVQGTWGIPWYGFFRKNARVQAMAAKLDAKIDYFAYGHFHQPVNFGTDGATSFHNGPFPMTDAFALNKLGAWSDPMQRFFVVDNDHGVIMDIPIYLKDAETEAAVLEGSHTPSIGSQTIHSYVSPLHQPGLQMITAEDIENA